MRRHCSRRRKKMPFAEGHDGWVLLNPGPACTTERVRAALLRGDLCHRESEFSDLLLGLQRKLRAALMLPPETGVALVTGSGTAAMEMAVASAVRPGRALVVVNNGVYGERLVAIARAHDIAVVEVRAPWTVTPPLDELAAVLAERRDIDAVAAVHHETTTGLLNPIAEIGRLARRAQVPFILDGISSMGCDPLDMQGAGADFLIGTANKGFHGLPGISFVYLSPLGRERVAEVPPRSLYLHLGSYLGPQERGDVPFTPAVQVCYALDEALDELAERGGVPARLADYAARAALIRAGLAERRLEQLLPPDVPRSQAVTAVRLPAGQTYRELHDGLKEQGYIIYAGQGALSAEVFRIATMGELSLATLRGFLEALSRALSRSAAGVSPAHP
jgi:2-aminoethylphosphonate-pyruvate transaminase